LRSHRQWRAPRDRELQELVSELMSTQLDHAKPLWDM
jgi:hypothetical protein